MSVRGSLPTFAKHATVSKMSSQEKTKVLSMVLKPPRLPAVYAAICATSRNKPECADPVWQCPENCQTAVRFKGWTTGTDLEEIWQPAAKRLRKFLIADDE